MASAFVEVLELAREMKLLKLGCVSIDGTHLRASASKDKNVSYERAGQLREQLRLDVAGLLAQAEVADREDADPQKLPEKLLRKMEEACAQLETRAKARAEAERADYERKVAARAEREGSAKGPEPKPPKDTPEPGAQIKLTDADAPLMRKSKRECVARERFSSNAERTLHSRRSGKVTRRATTRRPWSIPRAASSSSGTA